MFKSSKLFWYDKYKGMHYERYVCLKWHFMVCTPWIYHYVKEKENFKYLSVVFSVPFSVLFPVQTIYLDMRNKKNTKKHNDKIYMS